LSGSGLCNLIAGTPDKELTLYHLTTAGIPGQPIFFQHRVEVAGFHAVAQA
jgi:hypothetical protein